MRVILLERVRNLGTIGEEVTVKDGYGRNFLLPKGKALRATAANKELFEKKKSEYESKNADKKTLAEKQAETLQGFVLEIISAAQSNGKLYGSVSVRDLANHLQEKGQKVDRAQIAMPKPITETGLYNVKVLLHPEVSAEIVVVVGNTQEEVNDLQSIPTDNEEKAEADIVSEASSAAEEKVSKPQDESAS